SRLKCSRQQLQMEVRAMKQGVLLKVPMSAIRKSDYRHLPFGPAYRPFFERMSRTFGCVMPDKDNSPEGWEDDFRRDTHPEREMACWRDMADLFEHFTQGEGWGLDRKKELFVLLMDCLSYGPKLTLRKRGHCHLSRAETKRIVRRATALTGGQPRPPV